MLASAVQITVFSRYNVVMRVPVRVGCFFFFLFLHQAACHGDDTLGPLFQGDPYSSDGCDESAQERGCFLSCACENKVTWEPDPDENMVKFTLWGPVTGNTGYVALGISLNDDMEATDVYACVADSGTLSLKRYWNQNSGKSADMRTVKGASIIENNIVDGEIRCQFYRNMSLNDGDPEFYDISGNDSHHILLARGDTLDGSGEITYHSARGASEAVILSQTFSAGAGEEDAALMKVHGSLMVIAWIGLASIGITMARYFKPMWPNSKICDVKVWFAIHRACMVTALILFIIAFIVIFIHVEGFVELGTGADSKRRFTHSILGVIVTALGILNPVMALFRPHPGTPNRPIFNWAHWGVGMSGLVLAAVTVALATAPINDITILPGLETYTFWVLIAFIGFHILVWIILDILRFTTDSAGRTDDIPLGGKGDNSQPIQDDSPNGSFLKNVLLFIYCVGVAFSVIFIVINIAIA